MRASGRTPSNPRRAITDSREDQSPEAGFPDSCCCPNNAGVRSHTRAGLLPRSSSQRSLLRLVQAPRARRSVAPPAARRSFGARRQQAPPAARRSFGARRQQAPPAVRRSFGLDGSWHRFGPDQTRFPDLQRGWRLIPVLAARSRTRLSSIRPTGSFPSVAIRLAPVAHTSRCDALGGPGRPARRAALRMPCRRPASWYRPTQCGTLSTAPHRTGRQTPSRILAVGSLRLPRRPWHGSPCHPVIRLLGGGKGTRWLPPETERAVRGRTELRRDELIWS
jgi:hypothetical protein